MALIASWPPKDPNSTLDYTFDWVDWLANEGNGDTISTFTVVADTTDGALTVGTPTHSAGVVTVWLSAGTLAYKYTVRCRIVTTGGRTEDRSMYLTIAQR